MKSFLVLAPGRFMNEPGVELAIKSFAQLYNNVTPKHQRRLNLVIIEEESHIPILQNQLSREPFGNAVRIISRRDIENTEIAYQSASLFLLPIKMDGYKVIPEALSFGLPILTYENPSNKTLLDNTCSMLVGRRSKDNPYEEFSRLLEMLYFDPEVRKILARGAIQKYEKVIN